MDALTAQRMHELLAHKVGEHPGSCPVCESQAGHPAAREPEKPKDKADVILRQVESMERERSFNDG